MHHKLAAQLHCSPSPVKHTPAIQLNQIYFEFYACMPMGMKQERQWQCSFNGCLEIRTFFFLLRKRRAKFAFISSNTQGRVIGSQQRNGSPQCSPVPLNFEMSQQKHAISVEFHQAEPVEPCDVFLTMCCVAARLQY